MTKIVKLQVENYILNIVHVQCTLQLLKATGPRWTIYNNIFLSHSYILVFLLKSLFTITLILICITVSHHIVRKSFLFPLHCIALQEKCHFLTTTTYCSALFQTVIVQMRVLEGEDEVSVEQTVNSEFLELTS